MTVGKSWRFYMLRMHAEKACFVFWGCSILEEDGRIVSLSDRAATVASLYKLPLHAAPPHSSPDVPHHVTGHSVHSVPYRRCARHPSTLERSQRIVCSLRINDMLLDRLHYQDTPVRNLPDSFCRLHTILHSLHPGACVMVSPPCPSPAPHALPQFL